MATVTGDRPRIAREVRLPIHIRRVVQVAIDMRWVDRPGTGGARRSRGLDGP